MVRPIEYEHEYEARAKELGVSTQLLYKGDDVASQFNQKNGGEGDKEFQLKMEDYCKEIWSPFFESNCVKRWNVIDLTQAATEYFQVNKLGVSVQTEIAIKTFLKGLSFPCDGIMYRWVCMLPFDYKFKVKTKRGIGIEVDVYNGYYKKYAELSIPLWLLIWDNYQKKRFAHKVQNPTEYATTDYEGTTDKLYYDITADCQEVQLLPFTMPPEPKNAFEEIALHLKSQDPNWQGGELKLEPEDKAKVLEFMEQSKLKDMHKRLRRWQQ